MLESVKKREPSYTVGGNVNWYTHSREHLQRFLRKLKITLPYDLVIPLLGIYSDNTISQEDTCTTILRAELFTISKKWKHSDCSLTDEWIKMWYIYTISYYSATKKNEIMSFVATKMQLEIIILSEISQK